MIGPCWSLSRHLRLCFRAIDSRLHVAANPSTLRSDWYPPASFVPSLVVFRFRPDVLLRERAVVIKGQKCSTASLRSLGRTA